MLMLVKSLAAEIFPIAEMLGTASCDHYSMLHFSLFVFKHHQIASNFKFSVSLPLVFTFHLSPLPHL